MFILFINKDFLLDVVYYQNMYLIVITSGPTHEFYFDLKLFFFFSFWLLLCMEFWTPCINSHKLFGIFNYLDFIGTWEF